jgi:hypothetical protein
MKTFLYWLTGFLPARIINDGNTPYLERYYLFTVLGWTFYLHRFVGSDPDRGMHCHPWKMAFSIILSGYYWEETVYGTHKVRWFNWLTGESRHRVILPFAFEKQPHLLPHKSAALPGSHDLLPCWTLFFHRTRNVKKWGFYQTMPDGSMTFRPYLYTREGNQQEWWLTAPKGRELRAGVKP